MIFVSVGTHEQPFDRVIKKVDELVEKRIINEDVYIQSGYSNYIPKFCEYAEFITSQEMLDKCNKARIIITHGGPGCIIKALEINKVPIVVPRQPKLDEHVDEHQILFTNRLVREDKIIQIIDIDEIEEAICNYDALCKNIRHTSHTDDFIESLEQIIYELVDK